MNKVLTLILLTITAICIFFFINYDIYSYHIWSCNASSHGVNRLYENELYFDRFADYPPMGTFIYILTGKVFSYISPLSENSAPLLILYKLIPILSLILLLLHLSARYNSNYYRYAMIFLLPLFVMTALTGQSDALILYLLIVGIGNMESGKIRSGLIIIISTVFLKQTAVFFAFAILFYYGLRLRFRTAYILNAIISAAAIFMLAFFPYIINGTLFHTITALWQSTVMSSPLSGSAINIFSVIPGAENIDYNYKIGLFSLKTYSLILFVSASVIFAYIWRKKDIWTYCAIIGILWFNLTVGLRSQHIVYPLFLLTIAYMKTGKLKFVNSAYAVLAIFNILLYSSVFTMAVFNRPFIPVGITVILSLIQSLIALYTLFLLYRMDCAENTVKWAVSKKKPLLIYAGITAFIIITVIMPGRTSHDNVLFRDILKENRIINYTKDRFIDLNIISENPFSHYLGLRLADNAGFTFNADGMKHITFKTGTEYTDNGILNINADTFTCSNIHKEVEYTFYEDTVSIIAHIGNRYSQIVIYDAYYEVE